MPGRRPTSLPAARPTSRMAGTWAARTDLRDPQSMDERRAVAGQCEKSLQYGIRTYVDEMDDPVMTAYAAWPDRLFLVDGNGIIAYAGGPGPFEFSPVELKQAIDNLLSR